MARRIVTLVLAWIVAFAAWPALRADAQQANPERPAVEVLPTQTTISALQPVQNVSPPLEPTPGSKGGSPLLEPPLFETPPLPLPNISTRKLKIGNRSANPTNAKYLNLPNDEQVALITGGIKLLAIFDDPNQTILDVESDQLVVWQKNGKAKTLVDAMSEKEGMTQGGETEFELYLSGNVVMRYGNARDPRNGDGTPIEAKTIRAERVYYDMTKSRGVFLKAEIDLLKPGLPVPAHFTTKEAWQLSPIEFILNRTKASASKLPYDPGLDLRTRELTYTEEQETVRRTIFGFPFVDRYTGEQDVGAVRRFTAKSNTVDFAGVPIMWFPYLAGDPESPLGPFQNFSFSQNNIFGAQLLTTWSVLDLIGVKKLPNENWNLSVDYMSLRGPALGTQYDLQAGKLFGYDAPFVTSIKAYAIYDQGHDVLAGPRSNDFQPSALRDRINWRHTQEYENFSFQGQVAYLSDRNFLEQYYKYEFDGGPNQETFAYLKYQQGNGAVSLLAEPNLARSWVTETQWLPKLEGQWLGQSFLDRFTYNAWGTAAYANLQTFSLPGSELPGNVNPATIPGERPIQTGRFDLMQNIAAPFSLGALRLAPYAVGDLAYYTNDLDNQGRGRLYGGLGARASFPLSRLYEGVDSEFLNLHGLYHKVTFSGNYYTAWSDTPYNALPQLDRLNDDATQQSVRDFQPYAPTFYPGQAGTALLNSPLYDPRLYAIRRLVDTRADTLDTIQVIQAEVRQRWQTKRGYEGMEHTVDYATLDLSASIFPAKNRDNFGQLVSFLEYNATWAVGDRNGFTSSGWIDPYNLGANYWNVNGYFNRPDNTSFYLSYREVQPLNSKLVSGSVSYTFSPKYAVSFSYAYDLSIANNQSTNLMLTRVGTDLTWTVGFTYNAIVNNFGFNFMVMPNLLVNQMGNLYNQATSMLQRR